jgi:hypothetical protein
MVLLCVCQRSSKRKTNMKTFDKHIKGPWVIIEGGGERGRGRGVYVSCATFPCSLAMRLSVSSPSCSQPLCFLFCSSLCLCLCLSSSQLLQVAHLVLCTCSCLATAIVRRSKDLRSIISLMCSSTTSKEECLLLCFLCV